LIPPLWHNLVIKPALKRWDNEMATPAERELASEQNRAAGWPDWFSEPRSADAQSAWAK
jgi:p-cymene monooxygenase